MPRSTQILLSPAEQALAEIIAIIGDDGSRANITKVIKLLDMENPESGKRWIGKNITEGIRSLKEKGVIQTDYQGHHIPEPHSGDLLIAAADEGRLEALARAQTVLNSGFDLDGIRSDTRRFEMDAKIDLKMEVLIYLNRGEEALAHFTKHQRFGQPPALGFLCVPGRETFIPSLPPALADIALAEALRVATCYLAPVDHLLASAKKAPTLNVSCSAGFALLLRGDLKAALALAKQMAEIDDRASQANALTLRASVAFLTGDDDAAITGLADAITALRKGTRKRKVFPRGDTPLFPLLALIRRGGRGDIDAALNYWILASELHGHDEYILRALGSLLRELTTRPQRCLPNQEHLPPSLFSLMAMLREHWCGRAGEQFFVEDIARFQVPTEASGWLWVAAEAAVLAGALGGDEKAAKKALKWFEDTGIQSINQLIRPREEWENQLAALETVATRFSRKTASKTAAGGAPARLAWVVRNFGYRHTVDAIEQGAMKNGRWKKGRKIALKRLMENPEDFPYLTDIDRAAVACARPEPYGWGDTRFQLDVSDVLPKLVGHPAVYFEDASGIRKEVALSAGEIVLSVKPERGGRKIRVKLEPEFEPDEGCQLDRLSENKVRVTEIRNSHVAVVDAIGEDGISVPESALERVLEAIAALSGELRVASDIAGAASSVDTVDSDPVPTVYLAPFEEGFTAQASVCPVPGGDLRLAPGEGAESVFVQIEGKPAQAVRNLTAERAALADLITAAPAAATLRLGNEISYPDAEPALELLAELHAAEARIAWPEEAAMKVRSTSSAADLGLKMKSSGEWFTASASLAVDPKLSLDMERLVELLAARPRSRFLQLDDGSYLALTAQLRRGLDDIVSLSEKGEDGERLLHPFAAAAVESSTDGAKIDADRAWKAFRKKVAKSETTDPELPSTLTAELRPYQLDGYRWMTRLSALGAGACLADDMGLGKTVQALALLVARAPDGPALVVAPTSVASNWVAEAARFAPTLRPVNYAGPPAARKELLAGLDGFDLVVTTYGLLQNDIAALKKIKWHTAVLDEAQAIKNAATKRAAAARQLRAGFRLATTGTPIENHLGELHSLFDFLMPGLLGDRRQFAERFSVASETGPAAVETRDRLRRLISPFVLRRLKSDVLTDLPSRTEITLHVELPDDEAAFYNALRKSAAEKLTEKSDDVTEAQHRVQILAELTKLRRACCHPSLIDGAPPLPGAKLELFAQTIAELREAGHKALVFSQFVGHLKILKARLERDGVSYQYLDGSTPAATRARRVKAFQSGEGDIFLISLKAGGTGLNLTAADYVIHTDPWWNPAVEDQASDRAHRIGQTRPVTIYRLITKGTVEERVLDLHARKRDLAAALLAGTDTASAVSAKDLLALLDESR